MADNSILTLDEPLTTQHSPLIKDEAKRPCLRESPSVTIILLAYNQQSFIEDACKSVLAQDCAPCEIILSDDCSTDDTFSIMSKVAAAYKGPHKVILNKNPLNMGLIEHVNLLNNMASGDLIVAAAGDDISMPYRVSCIIDTYCTSLNKPFSIHSSVMQMSEDGSLLKEFTPQFTELTDPVALALCESYVIGASHAWSKDTVTIFGDIVKTNAYEDLVIAYRSALLGSIAYIPKPLVQYRVGVGISQQENKPRTRNEQKLHYIKHLKLIKDVLEQRLLDCACVKFTVANDTLIKNIKRYEIIIDIYQGNKKVLEILSDLKNLKMLRLIFKIYRRKKREGW